MNLRAQVISGLGWLAGMRLISQAFSWAVTIVVIRLLSPADYGLLAMANVFIDLLAMLTEFGIGTAIIQASEMDERKLRKMLGFVIVVNLSLFAVMWLAAPMSAGLFGEDRLVAILRVLSLQYVLSIFSVVPHAQLARKLDYKGPSLIELSASIVASVTTLLLALSGVGVWALVWGSLAAALCRTVGLNLRSPFLKWPLFSLQGTGHLLKVGGNVTVTQILWFCYSQSDVVVGGLMLGKEILGFYTVSMDLASLPARKVLSVINQVSLPAFARIQHDRQRYASSFLLAVRSLSLVLIPVLWGMSSVAQESVALLLGEKWLPASVPLQLLTLIMPFQMLVPFMNTAALGIGRADIAAKQVLVASLVMPAAFLVGSRWGLPGLAAAWLAAFPFVFVATVRLFLPIVGLTMRDVVAALARPMLAGAGMVAVVTVVRVPLEPALGLTARMTILILAGGVTYATLTWFINRAGYQEIIGMFRR